MSRKANLMTAVITFSVALGIGFAMQYSDAVASRIQSNESVMVPTEMLITEDVVLASSIIALPIRADSPARLAVLNAVLRDVEVPEIAAPTLLAEPECEVAMAADTLPLALVALSLSAPCSPNAAVTIHHQGLIFSLLTDENGALEVVVPAMARDAFFISSLANGEGAVASTQVPDLASVDRAALQWQGMNGVQLHAREFGAEYGSDGHVWNAARHEINLAETGEVGFLLGLGDGRLANPQFVEVYTFPSGMSQKNGLVELTVEAEITEQNCGQEIAAQSIQLNPKFAPTAIDLTITMPDCGAIGEFLVLKNMFKDLTLAAK